MTSPTFTTFTPVSINASCYPHWLRCMMITKSLSGHLHPPPAGLVLRPRLPRVRRLHHARVHEDAIRRAANQNPALRARAPGIRLHQDIGQLLFIYFLLLLLLLLLLLCYWCFCCYCSCFFLLLLLVRYSRYRCKKMVFCCFLT